MYLGYNEVTKQYLKSLAGGSSSSSSGGSGSSELSASGFTMSGDINMSGNEVIGLDDPSSNSSAASKKYVDDEIAKVNTGGLDQATADGRYLQKTDDQGSEELLTWLSEQKDRHKIRNYRYSKNARGTVTGITYEKITGQSPKDVNDYKMFIATTTDGLTKIGQKLLQQSVESYVYAVLGAQASLRFPIVGEGAKSPQTQDKFRTIVKETIV